MFGVFIGEHDNKIDSKTRLSIPADFRREIEEGDPDREEGKRASMIIVYGDERRDYLEIFRVTNYKKVAKAISAMPPGSQKRADLQNLYFHKSTPATFDETGRIVLGAKLRDKLGLTDSAKVVGNNETILVWHPETFAKQLPKNVATEEGYDPAADPAIYLPSLQDD